MLVMALTAGKADAQNQMRCGQKDVVFERLATKYGEVPTASMFNAGSGGLLVHMFANKSTGTWTLVVEYPNQSACLMSSGAAYLDWTAEERNSFLQKYGKNDNGDDS